jgi:hypothetical protein
MLPSLQSLRPSDGPRTKRAAAVGMTVWWIYGVRLCLHLGEEETKGFIDVLS